MHALKASSLIALASLLASTSAFGSFGAHYLGTSRDRTEFRLYLDGGEFLGRTASLQAIRVTVHQLRPGQPRRTLEGCVYRFDETNPRRDKIECTDSASSPLKGVEYAREQKPAEKGTHALEVLDCVRRCGGPVPQRLRLEAEEDNH